MVQHHTTRSRRGESKMSVSWEPHTVVSAQTKPQQDDFCWYAVGYTVALIHSTLFTYLPSLFISQNFPISTKGKFGWVSQRGQRSYIYSNALDFFFFKRKKAHYNLIRCKFTNPAHIVCYLEEWTGTSGFWGQASYIQPDDVSSEKKGKKMLPTHYSLGYKRWWEKFYRWERFDIQVPGKVQGKVKPNWYWNSIENERFRVAPIRKVHVILDPKCHRRLQSFWRDD